MTLDELLEFLEKREAVQLFDCNGNALTSTAILVKSLEADDRAWALYVKMGKILKVRSRQYPEEMGTHIEIWLDIDKEDV